MIETIKCLTDNNFDVYKADSLEDAKKIFIEEIFLPTQPQIVSYGDSETLKSTGILNFLKNNDTCHFIDTFDPSDSWKEQINKRKQALTCDLFLTGTNAITRKGQLVNLDMIGNRIGAITFGPRYVIVFCKKEKIVANLEEAMSVIQEKLAPINAKRHTNIKTPCQFDGYCHHCKSPQRICNAWSIIEKSYPKHRIKIVLI